MTTKFDFVFEISKWFYNKCTNIYNNIKDGDNICNYYLIINNYNDYSKSGNLEKVLKLCYNNLYNLGLRDYKIEIFREDISFSDYSYSMYVVPSLRDYSHNYVGSEKLLSTNDSVVSYASIYISKIESIINDRCQKFMDIIKKDSESNSLLCSYTIKINLGEKLFVLSDEFYNLFYEKCKQILLNMYLRDFTLTWQNGSNDVCFIVKLWDDANLISRLESITCDNVVSYTQLYLIQLDKIILKKCADLCQTLRDDSCVMQIRPKYKIEFLIERHNEHNLGKHILDRCKKYLEDLQITNFRLLMESCDGYVVNIYPKW